jgi:uncharacterized membrane protein YccC
MSFNNPKSPRAHLRHGFKTGLAAVLAYIVADLLQLKFGYWAALSAVIVMQVNVADSIRMCWYRFSGTAVGAAMGVVALLVFPATQPMTLLALFLSVGFCAYMTKYNARYRMAAITVSIIVLASMDQPDRIPFALFRFLEIGIGVACAFLVTISIWPMRGGTALRARLQQRFASCAIMYSALMNCFLSKQRHPSPYQIEPVHELLLEDRKLHDNVLHHERFIYHEDAWLVELQLQTLEKCSSHLQAMLHALSDDRGADYSLIMDKELRALSNATFNTLQAIANDETPDCAALETALLNTEEKISQLRREGATRRFYLERVVQFFTFYHGAHSLSRDVLKYCRKQEKEKSNTRGKKRLR